MFVLFCCFFLFVFFLLKYAILLNGSVQVASEKIFKSYVGDSNSYVGDNVLRRR